MDSIVCWIALMIASKGKRKSSVTIIRRMSESTMLETTSSFHQHVCTMDTTMMKLTRSLLQCNSLQGQVLSLILSVIHAHSLKRKTSFKASWMSLQSRNWVMIYCWTGIKHTLWMNFHSAKGLMDWLWIGNLTIRFPTWSWIKYHWLGNWWILWLNCLHTSWLTWCGSFTRKTRWQLSGVAQGLSTWF
jgi:hypothetical protein